MKEGPILCYVRPWNVDQFLHIAEAVDPTKTILTASEHESADGVGLKTRYYQHLETTYRSVKTKGQSGMDPTVALDMILRCRLLRTLPLYTAQRHLFAMREAVMDMLGECEPSMVLSLTTDSFVIDLIRHGCEIKNVPFIGVLPSFVNGYFRITGRGESVFQEVPSENEVDRVRRSLVKRTYTPKFNQKSLSQPRVMPIKRWIKCLLRIPFFASRRIISRDPYNYHYWSSLKVSLLNASLLPPGKIGEDKWRQRTKRDISIYVPLQGFPECSLDYWCVNVDLIDYYNTLQKLIDWVSQYADLLIKEHPNLLGERPSWLYSTVRRDERVTIVPTYEPSNAVLENVDAVMVWTGTVGFEAALRGLPVFTLGRPYYQYGQRFRSIDCDAQWSTLSGHIETCQATPVTEEEQWELTRHLLSQLSRGRFKNDGEWTASNPKDRGDAEEMGQSIRSYVLRQYCRS